MRNKRTGNYDEYVRLLNKYKTRHPLEKWSKESYKEESKNVRINEYLRISEHIMDSMKLTGSQRKDVKYMIERIPLKSLHRTVRAECIILCLCIYIRKSYGNKNFKWQEYKIVKDYGLTCNVLLTVITNLCIYYAQKVPLPYTDGVDKYGSINYEDTQP